MPSPGITSPPAAISGLRPPSQNVATYKPPEKASKPKPVQVPKTEKSVPPDKRPSTQITKPTLLSATTSGDSTTVILKDVSGEERKFIPLGQDRIQRIFNSQNGSWCLVVCKVRGQPQYFAFAVDLASGEEQRTLEIPTMPERVAFERSDVVMSFSGGESKRFALRQ